MPKKCFQSSGADDSKTESEIADNDNDDNKDTASNSGGKANNNNNKEEKAASLYPPDWWWAERQVNEILAEHPGEEGSKL
jgi:hypothetical protein